MDLCENDSDGDGRSNGSNWGTWIEWIEGGADPVLAAFSHPGVSDAPLSSLLVDPCDSFEFTDDLEPVELYLTGPSNLTSEAPNHLPLKYE